MLDVVFMSYDEPAAEANFERLGRLHPRPKRLHGVTGASRATRLSAELVDTDPYFLVDGDSEVLDAFTFDDVPFGFKLGQVWVWNTVNPVNGLIYGNGGIKLCSRRAMRTIQDDQRDPFSNFGTDLKFVGQVASINRFNTSPFLAWRGAFREASALMARDSVGMSDQRREQWLEIWCSKGADQPFGSWAMQGARDAVQYYREIGSVAAADMVNTPDAMYDYFVRLYDVSRADAAGNKPFDAAG